MVAAEEIDAQRILMLLIRLEWREAILILDVETGKCLKFLTIIQKPGTSSGFITMSALQIIF